MAEGHGDVATDASGNPILKDIGLFLRGIFRKELKVPSLCQSYLSLTA